VALFNASLHLTFYNLVQIFYVIIDTLRTTLNQHMNGVEMRFIRLIGMLAMASVTVPIASADIYFWTDENGVKNFTNYSPPENAEVFMETPEADRDTAIDDAEIDQTGDTDRAFESGQLQAATERIEALREQVGELTDRLAAQSEGPPIEADDVVAETEEAANTIGYGSGYVYWPYSYGYLPYGYKGNHKFRFRHGFGRPRFKNKFVYPSGFETHAYGRQPLRSGHGSFGSRPGYRSSPKGVYHTGSGRQRHVLGRQPGFTGGYRRR
jgi:hypothetical protein